MNYLEIYRQANHYLNLAITHRSSDIFILPQKGRYVIQEQRGTRLETVGHLPFSEGQRLISYFKFHANMAITEQRRPQLGAMNYQFQKATLNLRLSTVGNYLNEESLVIRLIYPIALIKQEFLFEEQINQLMTWQQQRGLILFAGPTGSGKTTSIYHLVRKVAEGKLVLTIEDPVEVNEPNFLQLQVNEEANMSYQALIKVALRHRPDIFIIGEIRDQETAQAAIQAALSGHLVLSTVHAQTAHGVFQRLKQLKLDSNLIEQALTGVAYQRLIPSQSGTVKALYDFWSPKDGVSDLPSGMSKQWETYLEMGVKRHEISSETAAQFKAG